MADYSKTEFPDKSKYYSAKKRSYFKGTKKLKNVKMFEEFSNEEDPMLTEGKMKEISIMAQNAADEETFKADVLKFLGMKEEELTDELKTFIKETFENANPDDTKK